MQRGGGGEHIYIESGGQTISIYLYKQSTNSNIYSKAIIICKVTLDIHTLAAATQFVPYKSNEVV